MQSDREILENLERLAVAGERIASALERLVGIKEESVATVVRRPATLGKAIYSAEEREKRKVEEEWAAQKPAGRTFAPSRSDL